MYLHIGNNRTVPSGDLVGIFDADSATVSAITRKFLSAAQKSGKLHSATGDLPKSFVVVAPEKKRKKAANAKKIGKKIPGGEGKVYLSQLAPASLAGRLIYRRF